MKPRIRTAIDVATGCVLLAGGLLLASALLSRFHDHSPTKMDGARIALEEFFSITSAAHWSGPDDAPVVLLVYSDLNCGLAVSHYENLLQLIRRYPDHVAVATRLIVPPMSRADYLPLAVECAAEQGMFEPFQESFLGQGGEPFRLTGNWLGAAQVAGIADLEGFKRCVRSRRYASRLEEIFDEAQRLGVAGTPTTFVNGQRVVGAVPVKVLDSLVASELTARRPRM